MPFNITEIDGAPTRNGRLPVETDISFGPGTINVTPGIMKTYHLMSPDDLQQNCSDYQLFKTWSLTDSYLVELLFCINKKDADIKVDIDDQTYSQLNIDQANNLFNSVNSQSTGDFIVVFKNTGNAYSIKLRYYNTPVSSSVKLYIRHSGNGDNSITLNFSGIVYNERIS